MAKRPLYPQVKATQGDIQKKPPEVINNDDAALFRAAIGKVTPLPDQNRIIPSQPPVQAIVRESPTPLHIADTLSDYASENPLQEFLHNGLSRMTLRKLKRGSFPIEDSLDLHGNQIEAARKLLQEFLHEAMQRHLRCVLIIHGKGMNSRDGEAVLRNLTRSWLTQHPQVLAFCPAPPELGGNGAALILLKNTN